MLAEEKRSTQQTDWDQTSILLLVLERDFPGFQGSELFCSIFGIYLVGYLSLDT